MGRIKDMKNGKQIAQTEWEEHKIEEWEATSIGRMGSKQDIGVNGKKKEQAKLKANRIKRMERKQDRRIEKI